MIPETTRAGIEVISREELIARVYGLSNRVRDLEETLRMKQMPMTSNNSSPPPKASTPGDAAQKGGCQKGTSKTRAWTELAGMGVPCQIWRMPCERHPATDRL